MSRPDRYLVTARSRGADAVGLDPGRKQAPVLGFPHPLARIEPMSFRRATKLRDALRAAGVRAVVVCMNQCIED